MVWPTLLLTVPLTAALVVRALATLAVLLDAWTTYRICGWRSETNPVLSAITKERRPARWNGRQRLAFWAYWLLGVAVLWVAPGWPGLVWAAYWLGVSLQAGRSNWLVLMQYRRV